MDALLELLVQRELAERSAQHEDPVIQRALDLVGQKLNPIQVVGHRDVERIYRESAPRQVEKWYGRRRLRGVAAFRRPNDRQDPYIYINRDHERYRRAKQADDALAQLKLAATLIHEQVHNTEYGDEGERAARRLESDFFRSKLSTLPKHQRREAKEYLRILDVLAANNPRNVK